MEFLIKQIIKRLEELNSKGNAECNKNRGSLALDPDNIIKKLIKKEKMSILDVTDLILF